MSGQRYAQATSEESTELVTNRATAVNPLSWNSSESHGSGNLVSNFSNLQLSSHESSLVAHVSSQHSQFSGSTTTFPSVHSESRRPHNTEVTETQHAEVPDQHLR